MKKFFAFAAMAAVALTSCNPDDIQGDGAGDGNGNENKVSGLVLNELSGADKFIEFYNTTDAEISLEGVYIVKYDSSKDGGSSVTWTGKAGQTIAAKGWFYVESSDLADEAEGGDPAYEYQSADHVFKGGLSGKKNLKIELFNAAGESLDAFQRGEEGAGWNQVSGFTNNKKNTFSRVPDGNGEWAYAAPTKGAANGEKQGDIEMEPEM